MVSKSALYQCILILCLGIPLIVVASSSVDLTTHIPIAKLGCQETCKNSTIKIPYPFGIGTNCYYDPWYEIVCNVSSSSSSSSSPSGVERPILKAFNVEILSLRSCLSGNCDVSDLRLEIATPWKNICTSEKQVIMDMDKSPFRMSSIGNKLVVKGCPSVSTLMDRKGETVGRCTSVCEGSNNSSTSGDQRNSSSSCDGLGCCTISLDDNQPYLGLDFYQIALGNSSNSNRANQTCVEFALVEWLIMPEEDTDVYDNLPRDNLVPTELHWMPPALLEEIFVSSKNHKSSDFSCKPFCGVYDEIQCVNICTCNDGFEGNPYIPNGCQDPCKVGSNHSSLNCERRALAITSKPVLGLMIVLGLVILLLLCYGTYRLVKRWRKIKQRNKFFKRNGGLLLQQQMISEGGVVESTRIFTARELEIATDNFNSNRVLGHGGHGTVYKGMLLDGRVVAVKKPTKVDTNQSDHFINEVVILSQINHRNVVKLLGCCLETKVPLLVYEFITNGTLAKHIHNPSEDFQITWNMRVQIAAETAGALAYLHSSSSTPIYHRDIKSSNILLDDKYRAKLSDFGTSRAMMVDQTHLTTRVQGTFGYVDPEYFQTNQYTEKSDVYSFGVVLCELLTSVKPVSRTETGGWKGLVNEFLFHFETSYSDLHKILDAQVIDKANEEEVIMVANLAKRCLNLRGKERPTMKEVASILEGIRSFNVPPALELELKTLKKGDVIMEVGNINDDYVSSTTSSEEKIVSASTSFEIQPFVYNSV
ncbi:wall-associated receptor kinase-like 6 [Beta vulgaris subsp. vulgaris]|uniref:wall-associated receptor kinase-like 6 n=1 Tax=Beta vulgaris subsp. vulgaris TaxID=3555 RepID=UPI002036C164|nr:wall-associated receptor kinase-like 6 [Beta vulgaris subsp. vulgaris]